MSRTRRIICVIAVLGLVISLSATGVMGAQFSYNTSTSVYYVGVGNDSSNSATLYVNTRPTAGEYGAEVMIRTPAGVVVATKIFPYHVAVSDLTVSIPSGELRRIYVGPARDGETVKGTVHYDVR